MARLSTQELSLLSASKQGALWLVQSLLDKGVNPNAAYPSGATALCYAADRGHDEVLRLLLERGASPEVLFKGKLRRFWTPFEAAAFSGHVSCLEALFEAGVSVHGSRFLDGRWALHAAAARGHLTAVEWLLARGADPNQREIGLPLLMGITRTPLMVAAQYGRLPVLACLVNAGARVDAVLWNCRGRYTARRFAQGPQAAAVVAFLDSCAV